MRYSKAFIPTVKEVPKEATMPSHVLLLRGGYARMVGAGIYELLPLGVRVQQKIAAIVREEMNASGAQEVLMPAILPAEYFQETGRWELYGSTLLRLKDRKGGDYHLGPTHEEIITDMVRREVKSYKQLPLNLYQIQLKYRDEPRPRGGLLRGREFLMKDAYSFDVDDEAAESSYRQMRAAYERIFSRLGLDFRIVDADSGAIGGSKSAEFQILAQTGEDAIVACPECDYAANVEVAALSSHTLVSPPSEGPAMEEIATPGKKTIDDVVAFLNDGTTASQAIKSLVFTYLEDGKHHTAMAIVRGDHTLNEIKLARALSVDEITMASEAAVREATGASPGSVGPVGYKGRIIVDRAATTMSEAVCGANKEGFHLLHVLYGRDYEGSICDIRQVQGGDPCPECASTLRSYRGIEGGHIFILGTHYSSKMNANYLDQNGKSKPFVMGCYGIGVSRLVASAIEQNHDDGGIIWPMAIAPYQVIISAIGKEEEVHQHAEKLYQELCESGAEVLLDDRNERPGVKFKDADLLGIPLRITVGARGLAKGVVEFKQRSHPEGVDVALEQCVDLVLRKIDESIHV